MAKRMKSVPDRRREWAVTLGMGLAVLLVGLALAVGRSAKDAPDAAVTSVPEATPAPGPLTGWTILVDAGHGGYDGGARCRDSGVWEKHINLDVAKQVEQALAAQGAKVVMTRTDDTDLCEKDRPAALTKKRQDMQNRIALAVENGADMVLSIHMNEYRVRSENGPQVFYRAGCDGGRLLAGCLQEALINRLQPQKQRTAMAGDYYILRLDVPSALVECGFLSNPEDERMLLDEAYQARIGLAVADGVTTFAQLSGQ